MTKSALFQQVTAGEDNSEEIAKLKLGFFTSVDCSGELAGSGFYITPNDSESFPINIGKIFGLPAQSTWNVAENQGVDPLELGSVAITFYSDANTNIPQSGFGSGVTRTSFASIPVTCTAGSPGECLPSGGTLQTFSFMLKTAATIGDPADGGVIACLNGGLNNLVVPTIDNTSSQPIPWDPTNPTIPPNISPVATGALSTTDGAANTAAIIACLTGPGSAPEDCPQNINKNNYAAGMCDSYTPNGGYTSGWFLPTESGTATPPSTDQWNCLFTNRNQIGGFTENYYWSSLEYNANFAWFRDLASGRGQDEETKYYGFQVRCAHALIP